MQAFAALLTLVCAAAPACGAADADPSEPRADAPRPTPAPTAVVIPRQPIAVDVRATRRFGQLVRLEITGRAPGRKAGHAVENPRRWQIAALSSDQVLMRAVNGPARVIRDPVGGRGSDLWDIEVQFWVAFTVPEEATSMVVRITAPDAETIETAIDLSWDGLNGDPGRAPGETP